MIIEIKTPIEMVKDIRNKNAKMKTMRDELLKARRVRGHLRVKLAETRNTDERIKTDLEIVQARIAMLESELGYK